ncbi:hypothetical protein GGP41_003496 [Bipolaris sorokiniana]|uniref:Uncharacterized protein n=1 Tax=Cochliobolus sativus TaxID=45130 RepID=A0A8H5ZDE5_COCSA|nr:hypothetical protein GGP41_003496 [Bipolaris sorokiniana]
MAICFTRQPAKTYHRAANSGDPVYTVHCQNNLGSTKANVLQLPYKLRSLGVPGTRLSFCFIVQYQVVTEQSQDKAGSVVVASLSPQYSSHTILRRDVAIV